MKKTLFTLFVCIPLALTAQFADDFSDGDFTDNPPWVGDDDKFIVQDGMLRLDDDEPGIAFLATQSAMVHHTQWDFWMRLAFTPSDNNNVRVYLVSDQYKLTGPLNGYFVQVGKTGGDNKRLFFYRQDGTETELLMTGSMNLADATNNMLRIRVRRDGFGNWTFLADPAGGASYIYQGATFDNTHTQAAWFGILCRYTITNSRRFYFDDFIVGEIIPDEPPRVEEVRVVSANTLDVFFSGMVSQETAADVANYFVDGGIDNPLVVSYDAQTPNTVRLLFFNHFEENHLYHIHISGIEGFDAQPVDAWEGEFVHYVSTRFDVVFNELMVNSRPTVGLPPFDWLELYNTTELPLDLRGWVLQHGTTRRELPVAHLPPKGYLVLCTEEAYPYLKAYGNVLAVPGLSATALTIGGTSLLLWDDQDKLVAFVSYTSEWYRDPAKTNGGWSLEKICPYNFCQGPENWKASHDERGGSPGETNSVFDENPDLDPPRLLRAAPLDTLTVRLHFSEPMDEASLLNAQHFFMDEGVGNPLSVKPLLPDFSKADLIIAAPLEDGVTYTVELSEHITDCAGNSLDRRNARLALPDRPRASEVVINEILFNPPDYGARYVELLNASQKVFDLADLLLASRDTVDQVLTNIQTITEEPFLFFPGDFIVLTNDTAAVKRTFFTSNPDQFIQLSAMPRMTNANGIVTLINKGHYVMDELIYCEDMHLPLLASVKGVALERLFPGKTTQDASNWHSAAAAAGYGTPAYQNSQYRVALPGIDGSFEVHPRIFAPDGSGQDDQLAIHYALDEPGYLANVRVFDSRGRKVKNLARSKLLASSGVISWDGTANDRQKAPIGIYVIHVEIFNQHGDVRHYKLTAVLAGRL